MATTLSPTRRFGAGISSDAPLPNVMRSFMRTTFFRFSFFALAFAAPLAVACSADSTDSGEEADGDDVSVDEANAARIEPGEFKLYSQANATPNPSCDMHTKLVLTNT